MRRNYLQSENKKKKNKFPRIPIRFVVVVIVIFVFSIFIYQNFIKASKTVVAGFNWTDEEITVKMSGKFRDVAADNMYSFEITSKGESILTIVDEKTNAIRENKYLIGDEQMIILESISNQENQCLVEADVSDIYYQISDDSAIGDIRILDTDPKSNYVHTTDHDLRYYVYPGKYSKENLPEILPFGNKILGIFLVDCENIDDDETLRSDMLGSIYYDGNTE